jgi:hypothetical protein
MKIGKQTRQEIIDKFEAALNKIRRFESVAFSDQQEMAIAAADAAINYLEWLNEQEKKS